VKNRRRFRPSVLGLEDRQLLSTFTVENTLDDGSVGSLRWAIGQANATTGDNTINFDPTIFATPQTITLSGTYLALGNKTGTETITGPAAGVMISGNNASQVFQVLGQGVNAFLDGLTIENGNGSNGGGLLVVDHSNATLQACNFLDNTSSDNGGGIQNSGNLVMIGCTLIGNSAPRGGGLYDRSGSLEMIGCTVTGNSATNGGGLFQTHSYANTFPTATLINSTVAGNSASKTGGGIDARDVLTLTNCTVSGNFTAGIGGGVYSATGSITMANTIAAGNTNVSGASDIGGPENVSGEFNLIGTGGSGGLVSGVNGNIVGAVSPGLVSLGNNGGPTETIALLPGSPAIAAGDPALSVDGNGMPLTTDQRGLPRVYGGTVDIGAYELQPPTEVNSIAVAPGNPSVAPGETESFTATATFSDGSTASVTQFVTWASLTTSVATINASGLATTLTQGTSAITASLDGVTSPADILTVTLVPPTVATLASTAITSTSATLNGTVNPNGADASVSFQYSTDPTFSANVTTVVASPSTVTGTTATAASASVTGLTLGTTYYVEVVATNSLGTSVGPIVSFTPVAAPTVTTSAATAIKASGATLSGTVNPNGTTSTVLFQYSTSMSFIPSQATTLLSGLRANQGIAADGVGDVFYVEYGIMSEILPDRTIKTVGSEFGDVNGIAVDAFGDVFVTDIVNDVVDEIFPDGASKTICSGFKPWDVAVNGAGDVFVSDLTNQAVQEILPDGTIKTIASGFSVPTGVAVDAFGDVFVADSGNNAVKEVHPDGTITTVGSGFGNPQGVAVDAFGDVFVSDVAKQAVKEVFPDGTITPLSGFSNPGNIDGLPVKIAVDGAGDVFVVDYSKSRIVELSSPSITTTPASMNGYNSQTVSATLAGLAPATTYYVRALATSDVGTGFGSTISFTTLAAPPTVANVDQVTPTISWTDPADIVYGTALSAAQLDATASVPGTYAYTPAAGTELSAGAGQTLAVTFTPTDSTDYTTATASVTINVDRATPTITLDAPPDIAFGTALNSTQLDASTGVAGTYAYTPTAGTFLGVGSDQTLSVTFMPTDTADYTTAMASTTITVDKALPILYLSDPGGTFDGSPYPASVTIGVSGSGNAPSNSLGGAVPTLTYYVGPNTTGESLGSTPPAGAGTYTVVASFAGTDDYSSIQSAPVSFMIQAASSRITLTSSASAAVFGEPITFVATVNGAAMPSGTVTFLDSGRLLGTAPVNSSGTAMMITSSLATGTHAITASYSGDVNFEPADSGAATESVGRSATAVVFVPKPILKKKKVLFEHLTVQVAPMSPGGGLPTGIVTFELLTKKRQKTSTKIIGTAAVTGGAATLTVKPSQVIGNTITIVYSGDGNFGPSTMTAPKLPKNGL
jgi:hypothetical protein